MSTYAIGDVQGCLGALERLLAHISFDAEQDTLWFTGDLINRGPQSLETLRFIKSLGDKHRIVLGNHDLHLIALVYGVSEQKQYDTLDTILAAPDRMDLIEWLRHQPMLHYDEHHQTIMTHAGLAPMWTVEKARKLAQEVESALRGDNVAVFLREMYGNEPSRWQDDLEGADRLRCIVNYLTRMRYCKKDGTLDLNYKGNTIDDPETWLPWFKVPDRNNTNVDILFGHWAALEGKVSVPHLYALDTGCVWGNCLTALRLEDKKRFDVSCKN